MAPKKGKEEKSKRAAEQELEDQKATDPSGSVLNSQADIKGGRSSNAAQSAVLAQETKGLDAAGDAKSGEVTSKLEDVKISALKLDLSQSHIYKYALEFHPAKYFSRDEKSQLAQMFLAAARVDPSDSAVVLGNQFEIFLPYPNATFMDKALYLPFFRRPFRKNPLYTKAFLRSHHEDVWSKFAPPSVVDVSELPEILRPPSTFPEFEHCAVIARGPQFNLRGFLEGNEPQSKEDILDALEKIFLQHAVGPERLWSRDMGGNFGGPKQLLKLGTKTFDVRSAATRVGSGVELYFGTKASFVATKGGIFKVTRPCHGFFFKSMNLAELVTMLLGEGKGRIDWEVFSNLFKGLTIESSFGQGRAYRQKNQIVALGEETPKNQQFDSQKYGLINVEAYMQQGMKISRLWCPG